jgi:glycosyltransferase involved in cell wall biosynthesis
MHICHVITRLIIGGAQENTILSCEGLRALGHEVTLISGPTRGAEGSLVDRARAGEYRYIEVPELIRAVNPWYDARAMRELQGVFDQIHPDLVHTHSSKAGIVGRFAADRARIPRIVHTIHGMSFNRTQPWPVRRLYQLFERRAAGKSHAIVTVADAMIEQMVAADICSRKKLRTIYSGMEIERFTPTHYDRAAVRAGWGMTDAHVVVGTVSRLFRRKGYEQLVPIMARAAAQDARLRFVWVGDGAQRDEYEAQLRSLGLRDRTTLTGLMPPERVPEMIAGFDILAHASQWEGLPRAVVQGLLMRVPAVAFAIDGTPEVVIDGQTGRLVPLNDLERFAAALCELAQDMPARQRMGAAGREHCLERFDRRVMVRKLDELYGSLSAR